MTALEIWRFLEDTIEQAPSDVRDNSRVATFVNMAWHRLHECADCGAQTSLEANRLCASCSSKQAAFIASQTITPPTTRTRRASRGKLHALTHQSA